MRSKRDRLDRRRSTALGGDLRDAARIDSDKVTVGRLRTETPAPAPISERRVYRAEDRPVGTARRQRRSPVFALLVIVVVAVVIAFVGLAARDGGLSGPQGQTGTFKLLPITTTTTS